MIDQRHTDVLEFETPAYRKRRRRLGDRKDGRKIRSLPSMNYVIPFIMKERSDSQNHFEDVIDITNIEKYLDEKHNAGYTDMTLLHVVIAAYVRVVSERPGINRFVSGQQIFARNDIQVNMDIKKEFTLEGEGTCIKVFFDPRDNVDNVYKKFQTVASDAIHKETNFDNTARILTKLPRLLFRFAIGFFDFLDYFNLLPKKLLKISPFHGSMFITHMGSLGIPAIYHHLYNFGNVPVFVAVGSIFSGEYTNRDGSKERHHFVTIKVVTDERICDGYYYASAFKRMKKYLHHPMLLDEILPDDKVKEDID